MHPRRRQAWSLPGATLTSRSMGLVTRAAVRSIRPASYPTSQWATTSHLWRVHSSQALRLWPMGPGTRPVKVWDAVWLETPHAARREETSSKPIRNSPMAQMEGRYPDAESQSDSRLAKGMILKQSKPLAEEIPRRRQATLLLQTKRAQWLWWITSSKTLL